MNQDHLLLMALKITPSDIGYTGWVQSPDSALTSTLRLVYTWAGIVCVLVLLVASYLFVTSRGDAAQMKRSKDAIRGAVIGLIVVVVAFALTQVILGWLS